jgi:hypothetical protein
MARYRQLARWAEVPQGGDSSPRLRSCGQHAAAKQRAWPAHARPPATAPVPDRPLSCRDTNLWLSLGGFQETGPDPDHL